MESHAYSPDSVGNGIKNETRERTRKSEEEEEEVCTSPWKPRCNGYTAKTILS